MDQFFLFVASFIANFFSALSGGGAGLLQLPVLIFLGLGFAVALATHKIAAVFLGIGATIRHLKEQHLERYFALYILGWGIPGVILGANVILRIPDEIATTSLGFLTLGLGIYSTLRKNLGQNYQPRNRTSRGMLFGGIALFLLGILNGSLTSGTGLFVTLWLVRWFGLDYKSAVAYTMILVGIFWNGVGALTLGLLGDVAWGWLPMLLLGALLGGYAGSHLAITKGNKWIKRSFELVTILVGIELIIP